MRCWNLHNAIQIQLSVCRVVWTHLEKEHLLDGLLRPNMVTRVVVVYRVPAAVRRMAIAVTVVVTGESHRNQAKAVVARK
jgi:hypothetical protein